VNDLLERSVRPKQNLSMRPAIPLLSALALAAAPAPAGAADIGIGLAAPLSGEAALLGQQLREGVETAAANFPGGTVTLDTVDDGCTAEGGARAAKEFADSGVDVVVGFLCTEAIEAAMPILKKAGVATITPGVRTNSLTDRRDKTGWPVFRLAPRADDEAAAVAAILVKRWSDQLFAIVDDGTIYGRELAESFRAAAEQQGLKPVFVDNYRPEMDNQIGLVGRLKKAGASHAFVGGDRDDIAVIERDAAKLGFAIEIAGGEALRAAPGDVPLAAGTLMIGLPDWTRTDDTAAAAQLAKAGIVPEGYVLPGYAALQVAAMAAEAAAGEKTSVAARLSAQEFATVVGRVRFDDKGDLTRNPYRLFRYDGNAFVEVKE
jgi:branched-chain amino acid transport system substrate-binding protein